MNKVKYVLIVFTALATPLYIPSTAQAQLALTGFGAAEVDTHDGVFVLGGVSASRAGRGWSPVVGVSAYWLRYPTGTSTTNNVTAVAPSIGLQNNVGVGVYSFNVGYIFLDDEVDFDEAGAVLAGGENSVFVAFNGVYWGTGDKMGQIYASYNPADQFFGTEARGLLRAGSSDPAKPIHYGMDVGFLGGGDDDDKYFQFKLGPVIQKSWSPKFRTALGAGIKIDNGSRSSPFPYLRVDFSVSP